MARARGCDDAGAASYRFYIDGTSAPALEPGDTASIGSGIFFTGGLGLVLQPMADTVLAMTRRAGSSSVKSNISPTEPLPTALPRRW